MKKVKLPGDISRVMNAIGHKKVNVVITDASNHKLEQFSCTRDYFDSLMKCRVIKGDKVKTGLYAADSKKHEAKLVREISLEGDKFIKINDHIFRVYQPQQEWTYGS